MSDLPNMVCPNCGRDDTLALKAEGIQRIRHGGIGPVLAESAPILPEQVTDGMSVICEKDAGGCGHKTTVLEAKEAGEVADAKAKGEKKFYRVGCAVDAYVHYTAVIEAFSLDEVHEKARRGEDATWVYSCTSTFDDRDFDAEEITSDEAKAFETENAKAVDWEDPDSKMDRLMALLKEVLPELGNEAEQREHSGNAEYFQPLKDLAAKVREVVGS